MRRFGLLRALSASLALLCAGLVLTAPRAQADTVSVSTAPPVRTYTYNMCGSGGTVECDVSAKGNEERYRAIVNETAAGVWNADYIFLVEVCRYQFDELATRLGTRGYTGRYAETVPAGGIGPYCADTGGRQTVPSYGMALFVRGVVVDQLDLVLDTKAAILQTVPGTPRQRVNAEDITSPCLKAWVQSRLTWSCSVHLWWGTPTVPAYPDPATADAVEDYDDSVNRNEVMVREADILAGKAKEWEDAGIPVVLGGDFNSSPWGDVLDRFYESGAGQGAYGRFAEVDETDSERFQAPFTACTGVPAPSRCRSGAPTKSGVQKLDYTFFGSRYFRGEVGDVPAGPVAPTAGKVISDHLPIRGAAYWEDCGPYGATPGAVFRRDAVGGLYRYEGRANGESAALAKPCKVGTGWLGMKQVARQGTTLAAVDTAGNLWHYPAGTSDGSYSGGTGRHLAGTGFQNDNLLVAPGDFDGDGRADLITRDTSGNLWLHKGTGENSYAARVEIGDGTDWNTYKSLVSPGDFAPDVNEGAGRADLVGSDAAGGLWLHRRTSGGDLAARQAVGTGWQAYNAVVAPGDLNGDGNPDLISRDPGGGLYFFKGDGAGGHAARVKIGSSFPAGELLF
ncbi:FG-GAP repeat domain-containing protein [Streptomyces gardneri]|uniref:FG-GAP repeat domain-containing protein n=1 Tax=Streptomyces gardneri TaxID=66892 RepID=UPI0033D44D4D